MASYSVPYAAPSAESCAPSPYGYPAPHMANTYGYPAAHMANTYGYPAPHMANTCGYPAAQMAEAYGAPAAHMAETYGYPSAHMAEAYGHPSAHIAHMAEAYGYPSGHPVHPSHQAHLAESKVEHLYDYHRFNPSQGRELLGLPARADPNGIIPVAAECSPGDAYANHGRLNATSIYPPKLEQSISLAQRSATAGSAQRSAAGSAQKGSRYDVAAGPVEETAAGSMSRPRTGFWRRPDIPIVAEEFAEPPQPSKIKLSKATFDRLTSPPKNHGTPPAERTKQIMCKDIKRQWPPVQPLFDPNEQEYTSTMWVGSLRQGVDPDGATTTPYE